MIFSLLVVMRTPGDSLDILRELHPVQGEGDHSFVNL
jgi:hypothetical protein